MIKNIILIGASAGGLQPIQNIVKKLDDQLSKTAIVIAQHSSSQYKSRLVSLLSKHTGLDVLEAVDKKELKENSIYTCPSDKNVSINKGKFEFSNPLKSLPSPSVDVLFESAAQDFGINASAIILSGTGKDGSQGIISVKESGGITMAQSPDNADYSGMPNAAIKTNKVDFILSDQQIALEINKLSDEDYRKKVQMDKSEQIVTEQEPAKDTYKAILHLLNKHTDADFSRYKQSSVFRRIDKRIKFLNIEGLEDYLSHIQKDKNELDFLLDYLLIGVTYFHRDPEAMKELAKHLKQALYSHGKEDSFRIWIPGCSTGEEAYTIAIIVSELVENILQSDHEIQIFATDIDQKALDIARNGTYSMPMLDHLPDEYKVKYFKKEGKKYKVTKELQKLVLFAKHDLTKHPPFLKINLISCRNLLIYFNAELQQQVIPIFHFSLRNNGLLFLGKSENLSRHTDIFETLDSKYKIFRKIQGDSRLFKSPLLQGTNKSSKIAKRNNASGSEVTVQELVKETFYNGYEYPYIVIDNGLNIIEINKGNSNIYLSLPSGKPNYQATNLLHRDLRYDFRSLVNKSHESMSVVRGQYRSIQHEEQVKSVRLKVQPTLYSKPDSPYFIVSFEEQEFINEEKISIPENISEDQSMIIAELQHELAAARDHLNSVIEELEVSNEELQSLNEELQSSNEELQASNEELETSNEELQATNEELNVAYSEVESAREQIEKQASVLKISEANMSSVLNNTEQGFVLIDTEFKVHMFNNYAQNIFSNLFNISLTVDSFYPNLIPNESLAPFIKNFKLAKRGENIYVAERALIINGDKHYFTYNLTPVKDADGKVELISLSFIDITDKVESEQGREKAYSILKNERHYWKEIFRDLPNIYVIITAKNHEIIEANHQFHKLFNVQSTELSFFDVIPTLATEEFKKVFDEVINDGEVKVIEQIHLDKDEKNFYDIIIARIEDYQSHEHNLVIHAVDVTSEVKKINQVEADKKFIELIAEEQPQHIWVMQANGSIDFINQSGLKFYNEPNITDVKQIESNIESSSLKVFKYNIIEVLQGKKPRSFECVLINRKKEKRWFNILIKPLSRFGERYVSLLFIAIDIHSHKILQAKKDDFISVVSHELKTPLTSVKLCAEIMLERIDEANDPMTFKYLNKLNLNTKKLEKFISELLDISRLESGNLKLKLAENSISELINRVVTDLQTIIKTHQIILNKPVGQIVLKVDSSRIEQVLVNLINNASKYSPGSEKIIVSIYNNQDNIQISIQDFGIGIAKAELPFVFDRYYRVENQTNFSGLGIGLHISKEIISLHKGKIWVESEVNKGTIFHVSLPI